MSSLDERTIVIGAGPGGASAAIYLARYCHPVLLIDDPKVKGRTAQALHLENVLGFTKATPGPEFMKDINKQIKRFPIERKNESVVKVAYEKDGLFTVCTDKPARYKAKYVVLAVGVHDIMPDVSGLEEYWGRSIFQCPTCNWFQTKDHKTAVVSNDDGGIVMARAFNSMQHCKGLAVIPDRPATHFSKKMLAKATEEGIDVYTCPLMSLNGKDGKLESVVLTDGTEIEMEILYIKLGIKRHDKFLDAGTAEIDRDDHGYIKVDFETLQTSRKNLFAVGPCNTGHDQVMVAAGQGATAAMEIHARILTEKGI